jgi:hypothetical protein
MTATDRLQQLAREAKHYFGQSTIGRSSQNGSFAAQDANRASRDGDKASRNGDGAWSQNQSSSVEFVDIKDRDKLNIIIPKRRWWIVRTSEKVFRYFFPVVGEEEKTAREKERIAKLRYKQDMLEMKNTKKIIENVLVKRGFVKKRITEKQEKILQRPWIDRMYKDFNGNAIYAHLNMNLPDGVKISEVIDQNTADQISWSLGRQTHVHYGEQLHGVVWIVELGSAGGIPTHVSWQEMMNERTAGAGPLTVPLGMSVGGRPIWRDVDDGPHWVIAGSTGFGKSILLNAMICSIISYHESAKYVRFILVDCKQTELTHYEGIPHLFKDIPDIPSGVALTPEEALKVIQYCRALVEKRKSVFNKKFQNINEYNKKNFKNPMPKIIVVMDEVGNIALSDVGSEFTKEMIQLTNISRAFGVYIIIATQKPQANVIDTRITFNMDARVAFRCPTPASSQLVLDNSDAVNLNRPGHIIFQQKGRKLECQTPEISADEIRAAVQAAISGTDLKILKATSGLTPDEIVKWSANYNNFSLNFDDVYKEFNERISKNALITLLKSMDKNTRMFEVDGNFYAVTPGSSRIPRRLTRVEHEKALERFEQKENPVEDIYRNGTRDTTPAPEEIEQ